MGMGMKSLGLAAALLLAPGCVKSVAVNALGDALSKGGGTYAQDDDPELVRDATAFGLKTIESLLDAEPEHGGLLLAATRGFTQYGYAFLQAEADYVEERDYARAKVLRRRALRMYRRARAYGLRGLSLAVEGFEGKLAADRNGALAPLDEAHVGLLYWTAAAWAAAVALDKGQADLAADMGLVEALIKRARALSLDFGEGALHDFMLAWDGGRPASAGGSIARAQIHFERALVASNSQRVAPLVSYAETICVKTQDAAKFETLLNQAIAFDADSAPRHRLANLIAQKRARWLLAQREDLFL